MMPPWRQAVSDITFDDELGTLDANNDWTGYVLPRSVERSCPGHIRKLRAWAGLRSRQLARIISREAARLGENRHQRNPPSSQRVFDPWGLLAEVGPLDKAVVLKLAQALGQNFLRDSFHIA